jgi:hypothetical protein
MLLPGAATGQLFISHPSYLLAMKTRPGMCPPALCLILLIPLIVSATAAPISAVFGEEIPLRGTATGADLVYLFLTGPNLPAGGISLAGGTPVETGVPASFTRVEVLTHGTWTYTWRTGSFGRVLDPGTYVIYIAEEPRARPDLDDTPYATQVVVIGGPVGTGTVPLPETTLSPPTGTMMGGPLVTGMQPPATGTPSPASPGRLAPLTLVPPGAVALAFLGLRHRW